MRISANRLGIETAQPIPACVCGTPPAAGYDADIIILAFGRFSETLEAVASALGQRDVAAHVWVLDQGSAPSLRAGFAAAFHGLPRLSYYEAAGNGGVGAGRNVLAGLGRGRIIVALDNDAVFAGPGVVAGALAGFARDADLAATGFQILARDGASLDGTSWGYPARLRGRRAQVFDAVTFVGAGHAIRRAAWDAAGGYDPSLFFTWEEYDFCLRAIAQGWRINYNGGLAVIHKVAPEARIAWTADRARYFVRNRLLIERRWGAGWAALAPRLLGYLLRGAREGHLAATMSGIIEAIRRDAAQGRRRVSPPMRAYLAANDAAHRGGLFTRLRLDVLRRRPVPLQAMELPAAPR